MAVTATTIIQDALEKIGVYAAGETLSDADAQRALGVLNNMIDSWSNESLTCFANTEQSGTLTINKNQYTIGSSGDFNMTRPLDITLGPGAAYIQDGNGNNYDMNVVTQSEWNMIGNRSTSITSNIPDTLFYDPQYPLGKINIFPTPNLAYKMFWDSRLQLTSFSTTTSTFSFPPGYQLAMVDNLAVRLWRYFKADNAPIPSDLVTDALTSKGNVKRTNMKPIVSVFDQEIVSKSTATYNIYRDR